MTELTKESTLRQELTVVQQAAAMKVIDAESYGAATALLLKQIIPFRKRWAEYWSPLKKAAYDAHKAVLAKFNEGDEPAEKAEKAIKAEIRRWEDEQERIQREAQRQAQEEAEKLEAQQRMIDAVFAEEAGATAEEIDALVAAPPLAVAAPVVTFERATGISTRDNFKCRVVDMKALCKAIGAGKVPVNYVLPNEVVLNARARADRETLDLPGCEAVNDKIVSGRAR
jgi:hypothetical protein